GRAQRIGSGTISATSGGNGTAVPSGADAGQSLRLTAGTVSGATFSSWSSGAFTSGDPSTANPVGLAGAGNQQNITLTFTPAPSDTTAPTNPAVSINTGAAFSN